MESNFAGVRRNTATLLNFSALMAAIIACVGHDDDLFEEGNCGLAHLDMTWSEAARARCWESHQFLLLALRCLIALVIDRLTEVDCIGSDLWVCIFSLSLCKSILLDFECLHLGKEFFLFLVCDLDSL